MSPVPDGAWRRVFRPSVLAAVLAMLAVLAGLLVVPVSGAHAATAQDLLNNQRVSLSANARSDLQQGQVDGKVIDLLMDLSRSHTLTVNVFITGHSKYTTSGSISYHWYGRAVDISHVDGALVRAGNTGAEDVAHQVRNRTDRLRPAELGQPWWNGICGSINCFTKDHADHIHIGYATGGAGLQTVVANVNACGALYVKLNTWGAWEQHMGCGQAKAVSIGSDGQTIAVVRPDNTLVAKNSLWGQWSAHVGVSDTQAAAAGPGGMLANVNRCGALYVKTSYWGAWQEHMGCGQAKAVALGPDGQTVAVVRPDGALLVKTSLWGQWAVHVSPPDSLSASVGRA
jgi:hypothetical protein